jgi:hypothetical protein
MAWHGVNQEPQGSDSYRHQASLLFFDLMSFRAKKARER